MQAARRVIHFPKQSNPTTKKKKREQKRAVIEWIGAGGQLPGKPAGPEKIDGEPQP